jgi:transposase
MDHFAGLDVSVKETSVCIVDDAGRIVREVKVASEPEALLKVLPAYPFKRIGLEAGPLSQWLFSALAEAELPVVCVETRHMQALREQIGILHGRLLAIVRHDDVCRRLMTVPGVGAVVALTYRATGDVPARRVEPFQCG